MSLDYRQRDAAKALWEEGKSLGEISEELGCSVYELSPWLYMDDLMNNLPALRRPAKDESPMCVCGHRRSRHYPGVSTTACDVGDCKCRAFEAAEETQFEKDVKTVSDALQGKEGTSG